MIGLGTVGTGVARLLHEQADRYAGLIGRAVALRRVLVRDLAKARGGEAVASGWVDPSALTDDAEAFFADGGEGGGEGGGDGEDGRIDVVIEVAGGLEPMGGYVERALCGGRHVVTANKALLADRGPALFAAAREAGRCVSFEASCAGAIPCINAMLFGLMANRFDGLYGILNGTCNYMLTQMARRGMGYADALAEAQRLGYAEADPTMDVSGRDAAQKLAILAGLAFHTRVEESQLRVAGIDRLEATDIEMAADLGYRVKLLGIAERDIASPEDAPRYALAVEPCFVPESHVIASVEGPFNALLIDGHASGPVMLYGQGAGRMPTAGAVVSDLISLLSGAHASAFGASRLVPDGTNPASIEPPDELHSRFYLRVSGMDRPGTLGRVAQVLGESGISVSAMEQREDKAGAFVPLSFILHRATRASVERAAEAIAELDIADGRPVIIRIVDLDGAGE